ncbi:MAG: benzoyl-CoA reductase, bzd-type, subunit Q [Candidatus Hodarchaeales archaeon]
MSNSESKEYWRWTESRWTNPDLDWRDGDIISAGVDVGSVSTQSVVMVDGEIFCYANMRTGSDSPDSANISMNWALDGTSLPLNKIEYTVGTGYGRVNVPFAKRALTEIACHGRGANFMYGPSIRTVLDMGGQDCKAIRCDHRGKVTAFLMNDKCAAGTGRGMEVFADLLQIHINDVGKVSLVDEEPEPVSSTCVVFAKSEAVALLRKGWTKETVLAAYCGAMAHRVVTLLEQLGVEDDFAITGGIAKNIGIVSRIEKELKVTAPEPSIDPQLAGAIGGALFGKALVEKSRKKA